MLGIGRLVFHLNAFLLIWSGPSTLAKAAEIFASDSIEVQMFNPFPTVTLEDLNREGIPVDFSHYAHFRIEGPIENGDANRLDEITSHFREFDEVVISFDSPGGSYAEALRIGDLIFGRDFTTFVGMHDECLSACAIAFLGGRQLLIRSILSEPSRYIHYQGRLGFHAPFNRELPVGVSQQDIPAEYIAELFYAQAREAIRELQERLERWELTGDFVFEMLGYGPNEFLYIDNYPIARRNRIGILVDFNPDDPFGINFLDAVRVCNFLISTAIGPNTRYRTGFARFSILRDFEEILELHENMPVDGTYFEIEGMVPGRGYLPCRVWQEHDRGWVATVSGNLPGPGIVDDFGMDPRLDREAPFPINRVTRFGMSFQPFAFAEGSRLVDREDAKSLLGSLVDRDDYLEFLRSSPFSIEESAVGYVTCNDPENILEELLCEYPEVMFANQILYEREQEAAVVGSARSIGKEEWEEILIDLCNIDNVNQTHIDSVISAGECLFFLMSARLHYLDRE